ncbi:hypothetical protein ACG33_01975 [Steroidobacter denitrificans]|uniref:TonB-dependent receptor plug domain-containing protein n=1 Tax=Steroidobacter denitrificans TaxID=465721 RepID=A0A127F627_STEDE|nr:TonB-dependent receptor plug domain-containing protein [Steroidobacter denitrificans]AMN45896.1 hypothetical protein ACG33_01975 [Steroidobacter denitrificans]
MNRLVPHVSQLQGIGSTYSFARSTLVSTLGGCIAALSFATATGAETDVVSQGASATGVGIEEVMVTARRRSESVDRVPMSIAVVDAGSLNARGVFSPTAFNEAVPGLRVNAQIGDRNWLIPNIRGQGQTYGSRAPSVVPYLAEVPLSVLSTESFFDLENVQVLKGPQGTLFGKVTDGGAILLTPNRPREKFGGELQIKSGNYDLQGLDAVINTPIVEDKVLFRAAAQIKRRDGFTIDRATGKDYDNVHYSAFRAGLTLKLTDSLENYTLVQYQRANENGTGSIMSYYNPALPTPELLGLPAIVDENLAAGPRSTILWPDLHSERKTLFVSNTTTWKISDSLTLKNIMGYVDRKDQSSADYDGSILPLVDFRQVNMPNFWVRQYSEELQLQGSSLGGKLEWITGLYADYSHPGGTAGNERVMFFVGDVAIVHEDNSSIATFAQGSYDLSESLLDGLKFTLGARYTYEYNKSYTFQSETTPTQPPQPTYVCLIQGVSPDCVNRAASHQDAVTYNIGLDYQVTPDTLLYLVTRKGYKGGGYQVYIARPDFNHYDAETIKDVELGVKSAFNVGGMRGRVNLAGFYAKQDDIQRLSIVVDTTVTPPTPYSFIANAASATVKGIDFEASLLPFEGLRFDLRYTYTDYRYDRTAAGLAACDAVKSSTSTAGFCALNWAPGTPENQVSASLSYTLPMNPQYGEITIGVDYSYQDDLALTDESYTSSLTGNNYNGIEPAFDLINATLTWQSMFGRPLDLSVFGTNLNNTVYRTGVNNLSSNVGFASYFYGEPRMYGASLKYRFGASR